MQIEHALESRVRHHLVELGVASGRRHILVALSGGCDSVVLLYLLRFPLSTPGLEISATHVDHGMRVTSAGDAAWVRGLCAAWEVPIRSTRLQHPPRNEDDARRERYAFLRRCARESAADLIATAHHADDQAETVLFRAVRGTGLQGLAGMAGLSGDLVRPLLPLWRREISRYARDRGLSWREDATNASLDPARNRLRHEVLPAIERGVAPGARRSLVSLAALASEAEVALERIAAAAENDLVRWDEGVPSLARHRLALYDSAVSTRLIRNLLRRFGVVPGRAGTRRALQFITNAHSGRQMPLSGTLRIEIEFDRAWIRPIDSPAEDRLHEVPAAGVEGEAEIRIGGEEYRVWYGRHTALGSPAEPSDGWTFVASTSSLAFPLRIRGWRDGDRLRSRAGTRSLKKVFLEQRVPRERRRKLPLLIDANGEVVWVGGMPEGPFYRFRAGGDSFVLKVLHD